MAKSRISQHIQMSDSQGGGSLQDRRHHGVVTCGHDRYLRCVHMVELCVVSCREAARADDHMDASFYGGPDVLAYGGCAGVLTGNRPAPIGPQEVRGVRSLDRDRVASATVRPAEDRDTPEMRLRSSAASMAFRVGGAVQPLIPAASPTSPDPKADTSVAVLTDRKACVVSDGWVPLRGIDVRSAPRLRDRFSERKSATCNARATSAGDYPNDSAVNVYHHCAAVPAALHPLHELNDCLLRRAVRNLRRRTSDLPHRVVAAIREARRVPG